MAGRDFYVTLGVPRTENLRGIRSAFRDLVRTYHPDRAGPEGAPTFREVVEAYRVLSDREARRRYDDELRRRDEAKHRAESIRIRGLEPEPTRIRDLEPLVPEPVSVFGDPDEIRPSYEALHQRFRSNFEDWLAPKSEHPEPLHVGVTLSHREALLGGILPIRIPVFRHCPECDGAGDLWGFPCANCRQEGVIQEWTIVPLKIPPGVRPGGTIDLSLDRYGIRNLWIRAIIRMLG